MPVRCAIPLHVPRPELVLPAHVHALLCECLERELAPTRHRGNDKPFSTSPLRTHEDGIVAFEVGLLDDELEERLVDAIRQRRGRLPLGRQVGLVAGPPVPMGRAGWEELAARPVPRREFRFEFATPTVFRSGRTSVPLPLPKSIFGHYRSRWMRFAPLELRPEIAFDDLELAVAGLDIATSEFPMSKHEQIGFSGRVTLSLRGADARAHRALDMLAEIADYSGTGAGTPQGMGVTRYLGDPPGPSWARRPPMHVGRPRGPPPVSRSNTMSRLQRRFRRSAD